MEKTIEIQLAEHGERIAKAIEENTNFILTGGTMFRPNQDVRNFYAKIARTTK